MLKIRDLKAKIDNKDILKGLNIEIKPGEVHAPVSYTHLTLPTNREV